MEAFSYLKVAECVPNYSNEDKAICYRITGGVAKCLSLIDNEKSIHENIIEQIANGETSLNIIANKVDERDSTVLYSLNKLISVGLVEKGAVLRKRKTRRYNMF